MSSSRKVLAIWLKCGEKGHKRNEFNPPEGCVLIADKGDYDVNQKLGYWEVEGFCRHADEGKATLDANIIGVL